MAAKPEDDKEFLTVRELAERLSLSPRTVKNRMYDGTWPRGKAWFSPKGLGPRFHWPTMRDYIRGEFDPVEMLTLEELRLRAPKIQLAKRGRRPGSRKKMGPDWPTDLLGTNSSGKPDKT